MSHEVNLVILSGYMKQLGSRTLEQYHDRILNVHPALLPAYGGQGMYGQNVHRAVLAAKETTTGVTIHLVDPQYDHGRILAQRQVPVLPTDTPETLAERVRAVEQGFFVDLLKEIAAGRTLL